MSVFMIGGCPGCGSCGGTDHCHTLTSDAVGASCVNLHDVVTVVDPVFGTITLTYSGSGVAGAGWYGTYVYSYPGGGGCPAATVTIYYLLASLTGDFGVYWNYDTATGCPTDAGDAFGFGLQCTLVIGVTNRVTTTSCSSWAATVNMTAPSVTCTNKLYAAGTYTFTFTSPSSTSCCVQVTPTGCNGFGLPGATITIGSATGTIGGGGGGIILDIGTAGTYSYSIPRFAAGSRAWTCGDAVTLAMSPDTGYHCLTGCAWPIADTLHATHPLFGAITLSWSGSAWVASVSYSYPGFGACGPQTVTVTCTLSTAGGYTESWKTTGGCPNNAGGTTSTATWTAGSLTCYVPGSSAFTLPVSFTPSGGSAQANFYQGTGTQSMTITE